MTLGVGAAALLFSVFGGGGGAVATLGAVRPAFAVIAGIAFLYAVLRIPSPRFAAEVYHPNHS